MTMAAAARRLWIVAVPLAAAACQPLPHPFADDRPPASLLAVRDSRGVSIGPIGGEPRAIAVKLRGAVVKALLKEDIPASDTTASATSYRLGGRIDETPSKAGRAVLTVHWRLTDAAGHVVGEPAQQIAAPRTEWRRAPDAPLAALAAAAANSLVPLLSDAQSSVGPVAAIREGPATATGKGPATATGKGPVAATGKGPVVLVAKVGGAPGDGDRALTNAMAAVLRDQRFDVVTGGHEKHDLTIEGTVVVTSVGPGKQHVAIVWALRRADGTQVGTVGQQNDVLKGSLDAAWGDVADNIALAARSGILELVTRAEAARAPQGPGRPAHRRSG